MLQKVKHLRVKHFKSCFHYLIYYFMLTELYSINILLTTTTIITNILYYSSMTNEYYTHERKQTNPLTRLSNKENPFPTLKTSSTHWQQQQHEILNLT